MKTILYITLLLLTPSALIANTKFIHDIPDFTQSDVKGKAFDNGKQFCGPVAASNSILWLAGKQLHQLDLIKRLASKTYMNTSLKNGTGTKGMLRGIDRISKELFGGYKGLSYQGWRSHQSAFSTGIKQPQIEWMKAGITKKSSVWLNIGWYRKTEHVNSYQRVGGHWVTLVGYQGSDVLVIHDSSPRAGQHFANEFVHVKRISSGILTGNKKGLPTSAEGFLLLEKGMHLKSNADFAIIDGAIRLEI